MSVFVLWLESAAFHPAFFHRLRWSACLYTSGLSISRILNLLCTRLAETQLSSNSDWIIHKYIIYIRWKFEYNIYNVVSAQVL